MTFDINDILWIPSVILWTIGVTAVIILIRKEEEIQSMTDEKKRPN
jgi:hypothetical protein